MEGGWAGGRMGGRERKREGEEGEEGERGGGRESSPQPLPSHLGGYQWLGSDWVGWDPTIFLIIVAYKPYTTDDSSVSSLPIVDASCAHRTACS